MGGIDHLPPFFDGKSRSLVKTDNLQKRVKQFNKIKNKDRTQKKVDQYNKYIKNYNKAAVKINKTNDDSYSKCNKFIKLWNKKKEKFFKKYSY